MKTSPYPSRRIFLAGAGAALAAPFPAPAILAQAVAPIRIGIVNTFSGVLGYSGDDNLKGMQLYLDSLGWTIAGRKIELVREDDQANPQVGLQKVKKLIESDKVDLLMGPQVSAVAFALLNYIKESRAFLIVHGAGADALTWQRIPYLFRTTLTSWQIAHPMGVWVHDRQGDEIVLLATDFAAGHDVLRVFKGSYVASRGKVLKELYPPLGTNDFGPYLAEIRALNPPVTYCWFGGTDAVRFVQQYREFGIKAKLVGFASLIDSTTLAAQGQAALGVVTSTIYTDALDNPSNRKFVAEYRERYKDYPNLYSEYGYTAALVLDAAITAAGGNVADKDRLAEAMAHVRFDAPRGPFRFDPEVHHPIQNVYICEVQEIDGRIADKDIATIREVRDPGKKYASARASTRNI